MTGHQSYIRTVIVHNMRVRALPPRDCRSSLVSLLLRNEINPLPFVETRADAEAAAAAKLLLLYLLLLLARLSLLITKLRVLNDLLIYPKNEKKRDGNC
jgi:hypothetical protein